MKVISKISILKRWVALFCFARKNPLYGGKLFFGAGSAFLFLMICLACQNLASLNGFEKTYISFFSSFSDIASQKSDNLFISQAEASELQTPDFKIIEGNTLSGIATPYIVSTKVLGDVFGGNSKDSKTIVEYVVQPGDTIQSVSANYGISANTLIWANDMKTSSTLKVGQSLIILPTDGVLHIAKSQDTIIDIARKYSASEEDIISYNDLKGSDDIYIGDILIIPGGKMPKTSSSSASASKPVLASNYFIFPTSGRITQGLHFYNAIDVANKCGTGIYAAASGTVQRVQYGYNSGGGNLVTILHPNGTVTYYGHLMTIFVKSGDKVSVGDRIALMGGGTGTVGDGLSTGCHLHFQVIGAANPLAAYSVGATINMK